MNSKKVTNFKLYFSKKCNFFFAALHANWIVQGGKWRHRYPHTWGYGKYATTVPDVVSYEFYVVVVILVAIVIVVAVVVIVVAVVVIVVVVVVIVVVVITVVKWWLQSDQLFYDIQTPHSLPNPFLMVPFLTPTPTLQDLSSKFEAVIGNYLS